MFSRVTLLEIDTMRIDVADAVTVFREEVLPGLQRQPGYEGAVVMTTPEGKGIIISFWMSAEAAEASSALATAELEKNVTIFRSPPGREQYEVAFSDFPRVEVGIR
ncbi:MAG: hypothetical protein U0R50_00425 [Gaiellales bacterium]